MGKKIGPSIYIPTDKNIYDALQHKKVKQSDLVALLRRRNILVSPSLDKLELSIMISGLTIDYEDFIYITKLLENPNRKEKTTQSSVKAQVSDDEIKKACKMLIDADISDDTFKIVKSDSDTISLVVTYTDIDFTKTELRQRAIKKCEIEIQRENGELTFRMPSNEKAKTITSKLKENLSQVKGEELEEETISLENFIEAEARSYFFDRLINLVPGYSFENVSSVDVYHSIDSLDDDEDELDEEQAGRFAGYIRKAVLAGNGVLESAEFNQLHARGFFISKIVWTCDENVTGGNRVEFEAQFGTPSSCTDFKYLVRGIYNYNDRTQEHNVTRRSALPKEIKKLNILLEQAAKLSFEAVEKNIESKSMKKVKWLYYELPIPILKLSELLIANQYSEYLGEGFLLSKSTGKTIAGRYIEKNISKTIIQDPFGNEVENPVTTYYVCNFSLDINSNLLCIYDPPRTLRRFISKLHSMVGLGLVLSDITVDPLALILDLEKEVGKTKITHISSYGIRVEKAGLAKISVSGKKDIRSEFESITRSIKFKTESVRFQFQYNNHSVTGSFSKTGLFQLNSPSVSELISKFQKSIEKQVLTFGLSPS